MSVQKGQTKQISLQFLKTYINVKVYVLFHFAF